MAAEIDPDAALMLRVKQGEGGALAELVEKYKQPVMNVVYRMLRDATEAEDLAQNVFVQVYKSAHRYEVSAKFSTWLFTIARNLCLNEIRRRSRHPADSMDVPHPDQDGQPWQQFEDRKTLSGCQAAKGFSSPGNSSRTGKPFRRLTACYRASWRRKSKRRWPSCPRTSALPSCFAVRTN